LKAEFNLTFGYHAIVYKTSISSNYKVHREIVENIDEAVHRAKLDYKSHDGEKQDGVVIIDINLQEIVLKLGDIKQATS
jgi:hypothetical protein